MSDVKVLTEEYRKAAEELAAAAPKVLRAVKKEMRAAAKPLGRELTRGLSLGSAYRGGLGARLRSGNYTRLRFLRDNAGAVLVLRRAVRHPVHGNREVWVNQVLKEGQEAAVFEDLSDKLQGDITAAVTKALKETLK